MARTGAAQAGDEDRAGRRPPPGRHEPVPLWTADDERAHAEQLRLSQEQVYREQAPRLTRYFKGRVARDDVMDLVQESFRRVLGHAPKQPGAFLGRTAANLLLEVRRAAARRWARAHHRYEDAEIAGSDPVSYLEARDALARIDAALLRLKPKTRNIFLLARVEGRSYAEVGDMFGMTEEGVRKQVAKAMWHLRRQVGDL